MQVFVGLWFSLKKTSGYCYIAAILNNHMDGHRPLTQYVQPMDPKGFLIEYLKHLLNVIKQLGPLKHSTEMSLITWIYSFHFLLRMWIWAELCLSGNTVFKCIRDDQSHCCHNLPRQRVSNRMWRGFAWRMWHQVKSADNRRSWSLLLRCFFYSMRPQHPKPLSGVLYNGILVWRYCPSLPTEYNHMNQGWVAEQSTAEEMKRCLSSCGYCAPDQDRGINTVWTNPMSHTNQNLNSSKHRNIIQEREDAKKEKEKAKLLRQEWDQRGPGNRERKQTEGQKQRDKTFVSMSGY